MQLVKFDVFRFDCASGRLWSRDEEVKLTSKAGAVLALLVSKADQPVSKEELLATVWRGTVVTDDAITQCILELRKALGDAAREPRFIETRHRRGYRFVASVVAVSDEGTGAGGSAAPGSEPSSSEAKTSSVRPEWRADKPAIAVLPFENMTGSSEQEYVTDGITDDLITALSKHRSLFVIARTSTFAFKGHGSDVREIGNALGVDYVVEGSVSKVGGRLRIRAQLVETERGRHLWSERYDRAAEEALDVQDELTAAIAARIEPEVGNAERLRVASQRRQPSRVWDLFRLGTHHFYKATRQDNVEAQRLFRRAIELDPSFAEAHAWLSYSMVLTMVYFDAEPDALLNEALSLAKKAVELDDQDATSHFAYGRALLAQKAYPAALAELELAVSLNPALAMGYCGLGDSLAYEGRIDEAIPHFEKAIRLSPYDPQRWAFYSYRALAHLFVREFESALEWAEKATRVPNCHFWPFAHRVAALGHLGRLEELPAAVGELLEREPGFSCRFARSRLFYVKDPGQLETYIDGLRRGGVVDS